MARENVPIACVLETQLSFHDDGIIVLGKMTYFFLFVCEVLLTWGGFEGDLSDILRCKTDLDQNFFCGAQNRKMDSDEFNVEPGELQVNCN